MKRKGLRWRSKGKNNEYCLGIFRPQPPQAHRSRQRRSAALDVLSFEGEEWLSSPFKYDIQFTSADKNIDPTTMLMQDASLTLQAPVAEAFGVSVQQPQRVIQGVVTAFTHLSTSKDESRYALCLQPRLALLSRSHQNRIYQDMSVPDS